MHQLNQNTEAGGDGHTFSRARLCNDHADDHVTSESSPTTPADDSCELFTLSELSSPSLTSTLAVCESHFGFLKFSESVLDHTMVLCLATNRFPSINLTDEEQRYYDQFSNDLLKRTLRAFHEEKRPDLNRNQWGHVRHRGKMDVYKNIEKSTNPRVTLYLGKGLMSGTVENMMDGLYCDTTEDLRKVKTLLNYKFIDGAVFQVSQRRSADAPFRFAGIKWFAAKAPLGPLVADRDMLNYEVMGQVMDEHGNEFAFHSYQSIDRPEWPADNMHNIKRAHTATCYLYRQHSPEYVECFFQGDFYARGKVLQKVSDYAMAGKWLAVSNAIQCAQAKKFSRLMEGSDAKQCYPSEICDVCHIRGKSRKDIIQCAGCMQNACRNCSLEQTIYQTSARTGKPLTESFCIPCVKKVTGGLLQERKLTSCSESVDVLLGEGSITDSGPDDLVRSFLVSESNHSDEERSCCEVQNQ